MIDGSNTTVEFIIKTHEGGVKSPSPIRIDKKKSVFPHISYSTFKNPAMLGNAL